MENTMQYRELKASQQASSTQTMWRTILLLWQLAVSQKKLLMLSLASSMLVQLSKLFSLSLTGWLLAQFLFHHTVYQTSWLLLIATTLTYAVCRWWQADVSHQLAFALIEDLQVGAFQAMRRAMPIPGKTLSELSQVATQDAQMMEHFYAHLLGDWLSAFCLPLCCLPFVFYYSPWWGLTWLVLAVLCLGSPWLMQQQMSGYALSAEQTLQRLNHWILDGLRGKRDLLVFGQMERWLQQTRELQHHWHDAQAELGRRAQRQLQLTAMFESGSLLLGLSAVYLLCQQNQANWAIGFSLFILSTLALHGLCEATAQTDKLAEIIAAAQRLDDLLHAPPHTDYPTAQTGSTSPSALLEFQQLGFKQDGLSILHQLNFKLNPGEILALTGASGTGKTSCARLLLRLNRHDEGQILLAGQAIQNYPQDKFRQNISAVLQDSFIFNASIAYNISLGRPEASEAEICAAAKLAHIHEFIMQLPLAYASRLGPDHLSLSGGQRQRLALARAILMRPRVLILDEASSQLDSLLQHQIINSLRSLAKDCAILLITHQASALAAADRVLLLANGQISAQGRHQDLLLHHPAYAELLMAND